MVHPPLALKDRCLWQSWQFSKDIKFWTNHRIKLTAPSPSSVSISEALCCISKIASSQKSTKHSIFSLSPPSLMVEKKKAFFDSFICGFSHWSSLSSSISKYTLSTYKHLFHGLRLFWYLDMFKFLPYLQSLFQFFPEMIQSNWEQFLHSPGTCIRIVEVKIPKLLQF